MSATPRANILLIDDQPARLLSYEVILAGLEQNLVRAGSGSEALKLLMADDYAVILLDVNMPEMDGFETASLIHQHPRYERTPIIFVTGINLSDLDRLKGYELGAVDYVLVPVVPQILRAKVAVLVELYNKRRELQALNANLEQANDRLAELNELLRLEKARELEKLNTTLQVANEELLAANRELNAETQMRQRAQDELDRNSAVLRAINENTQVLIVVKDRHGRVIMANPAYVAAAGLAIGAIMQRTERDFLDRDSADQVMQNDREVIESGQPRVFEEAIRFGAGMRTYLSTKSPFRAAPDRIDGVISVSVDITTQKNVEDELKRADRSKDDFLAMLSHELRNPLAPLHIVAELLGSTEIGTSKRDEMLEIMRHQIRVLIRLVDDLMDVSRFTQGKIMLQRRSSDLRNTIRDGIEVARPLIEAANHQLLVDLPAVPVELSIDDVRISQVVANLLNNAAKYTADGGRIEVRMALAPGGATICVRDNGSGIPLDFQPRIFNRFAQFEGARARSLGGLGIGLSLVRDLVELHQGTVVVRSAGLGHGSEFEVFLPGAPALDAGVLVDASAAPQMPSSARSETAVDIERVLLVDDNESACEALSIALQMLDFATTQAHTGATALALIEAFRPTTVILDLGLPDMTGHQLAIRIQQLKLAPPPRLIALSGWGDDEVRRRSLEVGIDRHLVKPVALRDIQDLFATASPANGERKAV